MQNYYKLLYLIFLFSLSKTILSEETESSESLPKMNTNKNLTKIFVTILSVVVGIVLVCYIISKILDNCCDTNNVIQIMKEEYEKNNLMNNNQALLDARKYDLKKVFKFLFDKVFISSKYDAKQNIYKNNCTICLNTFRKNDKIYTTQCDHMYHQSCMAKYMNLIRIDIQAKNDLRDINNYFRCPNCKQYLFYNKKVDQQHKMQEKKLIDQNNAIILINKKIDEKVIKSNNAIITNNINIITNNININDTPVSSTRKDLKNSFASEESSLALSRKSLNNSSPWKRRYKNKKFIKNTNPINSTINNENSSKNFKRNMEKSSQQKCLKFKEPQSKKQCINIIRNVPTFKELNNIEILNENNVDFTPKTEREDDK